MGLILAWSLFVIALQSLALDPAAAMSARASTETEESPGRAQQTTPDSPDADADVDGESAAVSPGQWALMIVFLAGAIAVVSTASRRRTDGPFDDRLSALLDRYRRAATEIAAAPQSRNELTYQLGVLAGLTTGLDHAIVQVSDTHLRNALVELRGELVDLEGQLRLAHTHPAGSTTAELVRKAQTVRRELDRPDGPWRKRQTRSHVPDADKSMTSEESDNDGS